MLDTLLLRVVAYKVICVIGRSAARHVPYLFFSNSAPKKHSVRFPVLRYPGQRSEVRAGRFSLTELAPLVVHIVSWGGLSV